MAKVLFGQKLGEVMVAKNIDRDQLALRTGLSIFSIGKWLRGERMPGSEELGRICEGIGVPCTEFMPSILAADPDARPKRTLGRPPKESSRCWNRSGPGRRGGAAARVGRGVRMGSGSSSESSRRPVCVDLFCGAGGLSDGLQQAGFHIALAVDIDRHSLSTYQRNHPDTVALCEDVTLLPASRILEACPDGEIDLLTGGPSCQGYSTHGKRQEDDPRNFLFEHFVRLVGEVRPKWVVMENVPGLLTYRGGHFKRLIFNAFDKIGYTIDARVLCAADYGVPQLRRRIIFLATRTGVPISFPEPTHSDDPGLFAGDLRPYVTVGEAIDDLPAMNGELTRTDWEYAGAPTSEYQRALRGRCKKLTLHQSNGLSEQAKGVARFIGQGQGLRSVPVEHLPDRFKRMRRINSGELRQDCTTLYYRLARNRPAYTITCYFRNVASGPFMHPLEDRSLSYREAARLMSFRDSYEFRGPGVARQIGNAVPPLLAKAIGEHLVQLLSPPEAGPGKRGRAAAKV